MLFSTPQGPRFTRASLFCGAVVCQEGSSRPLPHGWSEQSRSRVEAHPLPYVQKTFIKHFREQWQRGKTLIRSRNGLQRSQQSAGKRGQKWGSFSWEDVLKGMDCGGQGA